MIILALYLVIQTWNYYADKQEKWNKCEGLSEKIVVSNSDNTETWEGWQNWAECNGSYTNLFMMYNMMKFLSILTIFMIIISWKFDNLKKKD